MVVIDSWLPILFPDVVVVCWRISCPATSHDLEPLQFISLCDEESHKGIR